MSLPETVTLVPAWFGVTQGDVGDGLRIVCMHGEPLLGSDPSALLDVAQALADRDRCVYRVLKVSEFARVHAKPVREDLTT